jgi:hypothetical protein
VHIDTSQHGSVRGRMGIVTMSPRASRDIVGRAGTATALPTI